MSSAGTGTTVTVDELWDEVVGQSDAVAALRSAAASPVHAYLLVGPHGSGKRVAATAFAAELLAASGDPGRAIRLVRDGAHPCLTLVERDGPAITAEQARDVVRRAALAPPEGDRQVFVLDELHLVRDAAPMLLKTIEEPPAGTVFVALAEDVPAELVTIASRCVVVPFTAVPQSAIEQRLVDEGVEAEVSAGAAAASGGSMRRARLLASDPHLSTRREAWRGVPARLDGTGATVCRLVDELVAGTEEVLAPLAESQEAELATFDEVTEQVGGGRKGERNRMEARHKRETRRVRTDELLAGLATLLETYRDDVVEERPGAVDRFETAANAVQQLADDLAFNPNESLALRALLLRLPPRG